MDSRDEVGRSKVMRGHEVRTPHIAVVGAGAGGLASAMTLAHAGFRVTVLEAQDCVGGKLRQHVFDGHPGIDCGPTVFTMRWLFDELFAGVDENLDAHLDLTALHLLARHVWTDGTALDLFDDVEATASAIAAFSSPAEAERYRRFAQTAETVFDTLDHTFMRGTRPNPLSLVTRIARENAAGVGAIHPFRTLWAELTQRFEDPRLRQLFGRYATYCGSSPFQAPGTLMLVAHAERRGVWSVAGGMRVIADAMADIARARGADIRCGTRVQTIAFDGREITGVRTADGDLIRCDAVVFNGDVQALAEGLLGEPASRAVGGIKRSARSQSAATWSLIGEVEGPDLAQHTVFFGPNYEAEFDAVFRARKSPREPTIYVHAPDRPPDGSAALRANERLFLLMNAPPDGDLDPNAQEDASQCREKAFQLMARCGLKISPVAGQIRAETPNDFHRLFPATGGALYGRASHGWLASFQRAGSRSRIPGLYLAGGSVHPGPGVPMAAWSGRLAAKRLMADFASIRRFSRVGTIGGTSTASAETDVRASPSSHS